MSDEDDFQMAPVSSSQLAKVGYHPATQRLRIKFKDRFHKGNNAMIPGALYEYADVPPDTHGALMAADADPALSVGTHFGTHIKGGKFQFRKVE